MGSLESFSRPASPEEMLRVRNNLQLKAMADFKKTPEQWIESGDAKIAADIFEEEPELLNGYFMFQYDSARLEAIIKHFEDLMADHRTTQH